MKIICPHIGTLLKQRLNVFYKEIFRKSIHLCTALVPFFLSRFFKTTIAVLLFAALGYTVCQILALRGKRVPIISDITDLAARARDNGKFVLGPLTLVVGVVLCALLWNEKAARVGIFALAFGDGLASLAGKLLGNIHIPFTNGKTCGGSVVCLAAIFVSSFFVLQDTRAALVLAASGMLIEILPLNDFDNILIPLALGGIAQFIAH